MFFKHAFCSYIIATINSHVHQWRKTTHSKFRSNSKRLCLFRVQRQAQEGLQLLYLRLFGAWNQKNGMFGELLAKPIGNRIQVNLFATDEITMNLQVFLESHPPYLVSNFHTKRSKHSTQGSCLENFKRPRTNLLNVSYLKMFNSLIVGLILDTKKQTHFIHRSHKINIHPPIFCGGIFCPHLWHPSRSSGPGPVLSSFILKVLS